jgi:hypothetical protein
LNQACVLVHDLESMLLRDPPQNRFSTASSESGQTADHFGQVRLVPESDICTAANCCLFDHLVGEDVELRRNGQAKLVGSRAVEAARWHCVRYVMAITKKRFSLPNCAKRTAHS